MKRAQFVFLLRSIDALETPHFAGWTPCRHETGRATHFLENITGERAHVWDTEVAKHTRSTMKFIEPKHTFSKVPHPFVYLNMGAHGELSLVEDVFVHLAVLEHLKKNEMLKQRKCALGLLHKPGGEKRKYYTLVCE